MTGGLITTVVVSSIIVLLALRWAHRCWGRAIMGTVFAPLLIIPLGFVALIAISFVLRGLNGLLLHFEAGFSTSTVGIAALVLTASLVIVAFVYYCHDLRSTSGPMKGPWMGTRYNAPAPNINQRRRLR